jgi:hypothetical protein
MANRRGGRRRLRHKVYRGTAGAWPEVGTGELLIEQITDVQLLAARARSQFLQAYHYGWFFELESQRASNQARITEALGAARPISIKLDGWGRAIQLKYSTAPLSCIGSLKWVGGRFNYGFDIDSTRFEPFPALYLAEDLETGLREMNGLSQENGRGGLTSEELALCGRSGVSWVAVEGEVHNIFDLTHIQNLKPLAEIFASFKLSKQTRDTEKRLGLTPLPLISTAEQLHATFMTENWREFPVQFSTPANSQLFGKLASSAGFEGALFSSTRTGRSNLALFPRQFEQSSGYVRAKDPPPTARCVELNYRTFRELEERT